MAGEYKTEQALLEVQNVTKMFGGVVALREVALKLQRGMIYGLVGPNGSGKTTLFNVITGHYRADGGSILYKGTLLNGFSPHQITKRGIGRTFQMPRPFGRLTVLQNIIAVAPRWDDDHKRRAEHLMNVFDLQSVADLEARQLSYGQKKQLDLARTLMLDPELVLLDEPTAGLTVSMGERMLAHIRETSSQNRTMVVVEHNMGLIMNLCGRIFVLDHGEKIAEGTPDEIQRDVKVINAYLGD